MVFNMRVVPVFMLQMTSISGLSIISCYCAIRRKRYSILSSFFLPSLSMYLMIIVIKNAHEWALLCNIFDTLYYETCSISPTSI